MHTQEEQPQISKTIIKPVSLSENISADKIPLIKNLVASESERSEPYIFGREQESYLLSQIETFIESEGLQEYVEEPDIETILWLSTTFMRASTSVHDAGTIFDEDGVPKNSSIEAYISTLTTPKTVCIVFNSAYIRVFETIAKLYNPELLEYYTLNTIGSKSSADLIRRSNKRDLNRTQNHLFIALSSLDTNQNILTTAIDPYHIDNNVTLDDFKDIDFSITRNGDILTNNLISISGEVDRSSLFSDLSSMSLVSQIGIAIQSVWQISALNRQRSKIIESHESKTRILASNSPKLNEPVIKSDWDLQLEKIFNDVFSDTEYPDVPIDEEQLTNEILSIETQLKELNIVKNLMYSNVLTVLDAFITEWDGLEPMQLEMISELIDNTWLHGMYLPHDYYLEISRALIYHSPKVNLDNYEFDYIVRKHGNFDEPKFVPPLNNLTPDELEAHMLGLNVKTEYFLWLARQEITEWIDKLPKRESEKGEYYQAFLRNLIEEMQSIGYKESTPELKKLKKKLLI